MNHDPQFVVLAESIRDRIVACQACPLRQDAREPVPFSGNLYAKFMIVGRNPGRDEDRQGVPFVGRGGQCLNEVLAKVGIDRSRILIGNTAKCYSTNDRPPLPLEYDMCVSNHLTWEFKLFEPQLVVALGNDAFKWVVGGMSVIKQRQQFIRMRSRPINVVGILHPGSAVRKAEYRTMMEEDFQWLVQTDQFKRAYEASEVKP